MRALVAEAVDLSFFLNKVAEGTKLVAQHSDLLSSEQDLHQLQTDDWVKRFFRVLLLFLCFKGLFGKLMKHFKEIIEYIL